MDIKGTNNEYITRLLVDQGAADLWNSDHGQTLVRDTNPKQHRLLAKMMCQWILLIKIHEAMKKVEDEEGQCLTVTMEKQGVVEHPLLKQEHRVEKSIRDAETKLGLTLKALEEQPPDEDSDVPNFT